MRRLAIGLFLALLLVRSGWSADPAEAAPSLYRPALRAADIDKHLGERWFGIYIHDKKVGWLHETAVREGEGKAARIVSGYDMYVELRRLQDTFKISMKERAAYAATAPYGLTRARLEQSDPTGNATKIVELTATEEAGTFDVAITENGRTRELQREDLDVTLADILGPTLWIRSRPEKGDRIRSRTLQIEHLAVDVVTSEMRGLVETVARGVPVRYYEVDMTSFIQGPVGVLRADEEGEPISLRIGAMFEAKREPEEVAKEIEAGGDLFHLGTAKVDRPLGDPRKIMDMVLVAKGPAAGRIPAGPWQSVEAGGKAGEFILRIGPEHGPDATATEAEIKENLEETVHYPIRDEAVVALAKKAIQGATTDREKTDKLVRFVSDYVKDTYSVNPLTVQAILEEKQGDCTEHAVLMTTLARAVGLPTRDVSGLVYLGDPLGGFGWHAWNEVVIDGSWVPVDPTWNETRLNATHIRVTAGARDAGTVVATIGGVSFSALEANGKALPKPEPTPPPEPPKPPETYPVAGDQDEEEPF